MFSSFSFFFLLFPSRPSSSFSSSSLDFYFDPIQYKWHQLGLCLGWKGLCIRCVTRGKGGEGEGRGGDGTGREGRGGEGRGGEGRGGEGRGVHLVVLAVGEGRGGEGRGFFLTFLLRDIRLRHLTIAGT